MTHDTDGNILMCDGTNVGYISVSRNGCADKLDGDAKKATRDSAKQILRRQAETLTKRSPGKRQHRRVLIASKH